MRRVTIINDGWKVFYNGETEISLPHTFNAFDYEECARGKAQYVKELPKAEKRTFIQLGAYGKCTVKINGKTAGQNNSPIPFCCEISRFLKKETNILSVIADNSPGKTVCSSGTAQTGFGGLYRDAKLIELESCSFRAEGVSAATAKKKGNTWSVDIKGEVECFVPGYKISYRLFDREGAEVAKTVLDEPAEVSLEVDSPALWSVSDPYLYTLECEITDDIHSIDKIKLELGFREIHVDAEKGLKLNGEYINVKGVLYTQDKYLMGNALTRKELIEDITAIKRMGANSIRLLSPADEKLYDICDSEGILIWQDIPFNRPEDARTDDDANKLISDMVSYNRHPSIFTWGLSAFAIEQNRGWKKYFKQFKQVKEKIRELDPTRYISCTLNPVSVPVRTPLNGLAELIGYSAFYGWYKGTTYELRNKLKEFFSENPQYRLAISEYGAECCPEIHIKHPEQGDLTEEYQALFHERYLSAFQEYARVWGSYTYIFDFHSPLFPGGINKMGLISADRSVYKDVYFLYKAYWSGEPFIYIAGTRRVRKAGESKIKVYSNLKKVILEVNGKVFEQEADRIFEFSQVPVTAGENAVKAYGENISMEAVITAEEETQYSADGFSIAKCVLGKAKCEGLTVASKIRDIMKDKAAVRILKCYLEKKNIWKLYLFSLFSLKSVLKLLSYSEENILILNAFLQGAQNN